VQGGQAQAIAIGDGIAKRHDEMRVPRRQHGDTGDIWAPFHDMCILHMRHGLIAGADADQRAAVAIQLERIVTVKLTRIVASDTPRSMASLTTGAPGDADPLPPEKVTASSLSSLASKSWPASATLAAVMTREASLFIGQAQAQLASPAETRMR
jgi:hypothetical protein